MDPNRRRATMLSLRQTVTVEFTGGVQGSGRRVSEIYLNRGVTSTAIAQMPFISRDSLLIFSSSMIKRPLEANRELFISLDSTTCPCIKVAWILLFLTFPRFKLRSCLRAIFYSFRIRCTYVCVIRITFRGNLIALLYSLKSRSIAYVGSKRLKQATRIYNV